MVAFLVLGSGRARIVVRPIVGVRGIVATGVEFLGTLMGVAWARSIWCWSRQRWRRAGMSGVRLVGALGRDTDLCVGGESHAQERQWHA